MAPKSALLLCIVFSFTILIPSPATSQRTTAAPPSFAPAPAPAPQLVNLTQLLSVAGPFDTFLNYLVQTRVIDTFQNQANNTDGQGITIFAPINDAFSNLKKPSLSNLTADQLKSVMLYHALPKYYSLAEFSNLSLSNPVSTFAGGQYTLNFTYASGLIRADSGWSDPKISSSVISTRPVAVYQVQRVLLPTAIFGQAPPPAPAPAPAPIEAANPADTPSGSAAAAGSPKGSESSSSGSAPVQIGFHAAANLVLAAFGAMMVML